MGDLVEMAEAAERAGVVAPKVSAAPGPAAGSAALENRAWETFVCAVSGWTGDGPRSSTEAYLAAYPRGKRASARANAARLLARPEVRERARWLREQLAEATLADAAALRRRLLNDRLAIIEKTKHTSRKALALEAMRDVERSLGLDAPEVERIEERVDGAAGEVLARVESNLAEALARVRRQVTERTVRRG